MHLLIALALALSGCGAVTDDSPPTPSPVEVVNNLPYEWQNLDPAVMAFQIVAIDRGWSRADAQAWTPFVRAFMRRESGGCWNVRRGARVAVYKGCVLSRQGRYSDSGFGQVLMSVHKRWLCGQESLCSPQDVVSSPWSSMTALVALVERGGAQPWCYSAKLRRGAICRLAP